MVPSIHRWTLSGEHLGTIGEARDGSLELIPNPNESGASLFYTQESFFRPPAIFECADTASCSQRWQNGYSGPNGPTCRIEQLSFASKDGTLIPITLVSSGGAEVRHPQPTVMTSYGSFGMPMTPRFSPLVLMMLELGFTFAIPHIRGGGDFGKRWHDAARRGTKQVAIDDFVTAADWLYANKYTSPEQLGCFGGSNSGLLVCAAMTQRPELFRAILCIAPLLDMVRYERFGDASRWREEYGSVEDPAEFQALHSYSPYHRIEEQMNYPSVLFVSGDRDDRCDPAHVRKMAARLQEGVRQNSPVLVDYSPERGHSPTLPLSFRIEALARRIGFFCREMNIPIVRAASDEA